MNVHTVSARLAAALVALIAGAASWEHIASVAVRAGERPWVAYSLPAAVDGLILVGVAALLEDKRHNRTGRWSARVAVVAGVGMTLWANIMSAEPNATARAVAVAAPVSFLLSVEVLTRSGRPRTAPTSANGLRATQTVEQARGGVPARAKPRRASTRERVAAAAARMPGATAAQLASRLGVSERTVQRYLPPAPVEASPNGRTR